VTDLQEAAAVARRVVEALGRPFVLHGVDVPLAVSIGIAVAAGQPITPDRLLDQADHAMYRAKTEGGAGYRFWDDDQAGRAGPGAPSIE
jgi:GGDEF domain-containing protein